MMRCILMRLTARLPVREITRSNGAPYLERYYLGRLFGWTFYLHRFLDGDEGEHLHDHPWRLSWSLILAGRYKETRLRRIDGDGVHVRVRWFRPGWLNIIRGTDFHRIALPAGGEAWTLFAAGHRCRRWGFLQWWWAEESLTVHRWLHRGRDTGSEQRWHATAPTGAQLRERQLKRELRARAQQIRERFRRRSLPWPITAGLYEKRRGETDA